MRSSGSRRECSHRRPELAGSVDLVLIGDHEDRVFRLAAEDGRVTISEHPEGPADAVVTGTEESWISALGPDGELGSLELDGQRELAEALLSEFTAAANAARGSARRMT